MGSGIQDLPKRNCIPTPPALTHQKKKMDRGNKKGSDFGYYSPVRRLTNLSSPEELTPEWQIWTCDESAARLEERGCQKRVGGRGKSLRVESRERVPPRVEGLGSPVRRLS